MMPSGRSGEISVLIGLLVLLPQACSGYSADSGSGAAGCDACEYGDACADTTAESVDCCDADDSSTYESDGYESATCTWYCADYEGASAYVSITYVRNGSTWGQESVYTDACI